MNCLNNGNWWLEEVMTEKKICISPGFNTHHRMHWAGFTKKKWLQGRKELQVLRTSVSHTIHTTESFPWGVCMSTFSTQSQNYGFALDLTKDLKRVIFSISHSHPWLYYSDVTVRQEMYMLCLCLCVCMCAERERIKSLTVISLFEEFYKCY